MRIPRRRSAPTINDADGIGLKSAVTTELRWFTEQFRRELQPHRLTRRDDDDGNASTVRISLIVCHDTQFFCFWKRSEGEEN